MPVLPLQFLQPLEFVAVHAPVFALPSVVGLLAGTDVADRVLGRPPFGKRGFQNAKLGDNLVGGVSGLVRSGSGSVEAPD